MSTRNFIGPSDGRLARAKLETPTSAAIHASARRKRRRDAFAKFSAFRARLDVETVGFVAPGSVFAPRYVSDAEGDRTRFAFRRRADFAADVERGARRLSKIRRNRRSSSSSRRAAKRAFSAGRRRSAVQRRLDLFSRGRRGAFASSGRDAFLEGARRGFDACGFSRGDASRRTPATPRLRDALTVDFGDAAPWSERGFYGSADRADFASRRDATARKRALGLTRGALNGPLGASSKARSERGAFSSSARNARVSSKRERTRSAPDFDAPRCFSSPRRARDDVRRWEREDDATFAPRFGASRFREGAASRFGRFSQNADERRSVLGNATRRAGFGGAAGIASENGARRDFSSSRSGRSRFSRAYGERSASRFGRFGAASFPRMRGARDGEGRRRGSTRGFYPEFGAFYGEFPTFDAPSREYVERFAFAPRALARVWTTSESDFGAYLGAFDSAASNRVAASSRSGTSRPTARRFRFEEDWRLPFPGIDGIAERALASRRRRARTDKGWRLGARDAAFEVESDVATASDGATWRGADSIDGRAGDARGLATIERLLKESRDALVALARDATGDLTLTTE